MSEKSRNVDRLSPEQLQRLIDRLKPRGPKEDERRIGRQARDNGPIPLSFSQERIWFLDRLEPGNTALNMPGAVELDGPLHPAALSAAIEEITRRHESLRTTFTVAGGAPCQRISPPAPFPMPVADLSALPEASRESEADRWTAWHAVRRFDLESGPLLAVTLLRLGPGSHRLLLNMHHVVSDGWSVGVLVRELTTLYESFLQDRPSPLPEPPIQYADFAIWQHRALAAGQSRELDYWVERLGGEIAPLDFPTDRPRPAIQTFRGGRARLLLAPETAHRLRSFGQAQGATLFMTLLAGLDALLHRHSGQEDILVGSPIAGRRLVETEGLIGIFLNTLVLRTDLSGAPSFRALLERVREVTLGAYSNQDVPFEALLARLQPDRDLSRTPFFQVLLNVLNFPGSETRVAGLTVRAVSMPEVSSKFDMTFYVDEGEHGIRLDLVYNADLFDAARIEDFLSQLGSFFAQVLERPDEPVGRLSLVTERSRAVLPDPEEPLDASWRGAIHELFIARALATPDRPAVVDREGIWSYSDLWKAGGRLASWLAARGVGRGEVVAIYAHRSAPVAPAVLGALEAGAAFTMLDPAYPAARLVEILRLAAPRAFVRLEAAGPLPAAVDAWLAESGCARVDLPGGGAAALIGRLGGVPAAPPRVEIGPGDAAVLGFTSGSTGTPKGIVGRHGPLTHFLPWQCERFGLTFGDRFSLLSGLAHDPLQRDLFTPLYLGGTIVVPDPEDFAVPGRLAEWLARERVSVAHLTPAMAQILTELPAGGGAIEAPDLRLVLLVGDALTRLDVTRIRRLAPNVTCVNLYGSTETQRAVAYHVVGDAGEEGERSKQVLPLGRGMRDVQLLVINREGLLAGVGEVGEIAVRSPHLARGYLGDETLTADRFRANPFTGLPDDRVYRTGDLGRYLPDGEVAFAGRADLQVKIRGFRIEPAEIEAALASQSGVREAVVVVREDRGEKRLVAYVVPEHEGAVAVAALRQVLRDRLPAYMVPAAFVLLERLPITPNGKVDRRALPAPAEDAETAHGYAAPETALEEGVAAVWRELLGVERIGRSDNFFDLGGHSLLGIRLLTRLRDSFGAELPVAALFESPTLAELAGRIEAAPQGMPEGGETPLVSLPREGDLPLSFSQERIWFLDQLQPGSAAYNIPSAIRLEGALDAAVLRRAIGELIRRHETLRTTFPSAEGGPVQRIAEPATAVLPVVDLSRLTEAREAEALRLVQEEAQQPFDLASGPLLRMALLRLGDREHLLLSTIHHIVADGWSLGVFARELTALYQAFAAGRPAPLSELPVQYADFASWQRNRLAGARLEELLTYWKDRLLPEPPVLELPVDRARPAVESHRGARLPLAVDRELTAALARLGRDRGATLFMTLLAGFTGLLTRYTGQEDIAVGTPIAGRTRAEVEGLIGVFINTLVLRGDLSGNPTFLELLGRVRATALEAYAHQDLPFEKLVEALQPERRLAYSPLFQVLFILQNLPAGEARTPGLTFRALDVHHGVSPFDLTLSMAEADGRLAGYLEYKTDLIEASTAERWLGHLGRLLAAAAAEPAGRLSDLPFLSEAERSQLLAWNDTAAEIPPACAHQLIAASAAGRPDAPVLTFEGECLAYGEIEARAARLAHRLRALGVGPEVLVGIAMERSPELLIATLGVWKAGGAYLPLDPSYPAERLAFTLRDSRAPVLITQSHLETSLPAHEARVLCLDRGSELPPEEGETALAADLGEDAGPDNLAYVIYTSGSTGRPKGVQITHGALVNFLLSMLREPGLTADDVLLAVTSLSFDIVALELYLPLLAGARLEMVSSEVAGDGPRLLARLRESGATIVQATPSTWRMLLEAGWEEGPALRRALCGGEALLPDLAARLLPRTEELWNVYGPTETTVWSTVLRVEGEPGGMVSIGRPIANTRVQVLDSHMRPCPLGIPGELWIGGLGVARGYLDRPELTADRFVPDPFSASPGARLYRTGDLARVLPDGRLDFLGRADQQVKIRGHRIELGEIEAALSLHPAVAQAAVVARDDWGDRRLVAYVAPVPGEDPRPESLRAFLRERLPEHMEPAAFVTLPSLPLTPNRKVDRKALPAPEMTAAAGAYVAPRNSLEEILAHVWAEVLRIERAGIDDDFFALGGHSLLAARIVSRLGRVLGAPPPVRWLFERPTVRGLAARIASERGQDAVPDAPPITPVSRESAELPLSFSQQRLWFLDRLEPENSGYNVPAVLRLQGQLDVAALAAALAGIVRRHEVLRTTFPEVDGWPRQEIARPPAVLVPSIVDLADLPAEVRERELTWRAAAEARRPFDLMRGPLLRTLLLRLGESDHVLALTAHHIVCDAWSFAIFIRELSSLYTAAVRGEAPQLPALPVQYADFAAWQRDWLRGEVVDRLVEAWRSRLAGAPAGIELPTDRPYPPVQTFRGGSLRFQIEEATAAGLPALARAEGATLFMAVLGAFQTLLHRYSGQDDVVVGSPIHGRTRPELEELIGLFINTLALRGNLAGDPGFRELLARAREAALDAFALQELPFERLIEELQPPRDLARPPLFQVMLILQNAPAETLELSGLTLSPLSTETGTAKFELLLTLIETGGGLAGSLEYNADLFDRSTAERLLRHFETLLAGAVADPAQRLSDLPMLSYTEQDQILRVWNATAAVFPELPVHRLFERQAALSPEAPALVAGDERLTYTELSLRANRLAHHLRRMGVGPEILVGVSLERSADLVVTLLGILKAGGAYLPLDPTYPRERLRMVLEDAGASVLLTSRELAGSLFADAPGTTQVVCLDAEEAVAFESGADPEGGAGADNLAYALFTSGSTGRPKGVAVPHRALVNFLASMGQAPGIEAGERLLAVTSLSFDIAALEIFLPLLAGGCVELATREQAADGAWLASRLAAEASPKIRVLQATPSTWRMLLDAGWQGDLDLKALCGGEALPRDLASALRERVGELWNLYGPTETTVWSAAASLARGETGSVTIGRPIANTRIYLLDRHLRPVPPSAAGRLHIGGAGVARGYLGRPDLTAERFVPDPIPLLHGGEAGARLYDTGDLARLRPDGTLEFLGRVDHQVKVRGFRIELGEIEAALARHPAVAQTVVLARTDRGSDARLVAYLVAMPGEAPKPEELRAFLREGLPEYMLPTAFVVLDAFPLTPNGKVDRKALPAPEITSPAREYVAPGSPVEEAMAALWAEVLGLERVGANDNFFELGGHSILATRLMFRVRETFGVDLPLRALFSAPTLAGLSAAVSQEEPGAITAAEELPRIQPDQAGRSLPFPLTDVQEAYWIGRSGALQLGSVSTHVYFELDFPQIDLGRLEIALRRLIDRHGMLRAVVLADGTQRILPEVPLYRIGVVDLRGTVDPAPGLQAVRDRMSHQVLPSDRWPLFEIAATPFGRRTRVHVSLDLLIGDAWSFRILARDLSLFYADPEAELPPLELSFRDYVLAEIALHGTAAYERALAYWRERATTLPPAPALPLAKSPGEIDKPRFVRRQGRLGHPAWARLKERAARSAVTPSGVLLAAFAEALAAWCRSPRLTINLTLFNRLPLHPQVDDIVGDFTSLTLLAVEGLPGEPFEERARKVQGRLWDDLEHRLVSGVRVLRELARTQGGAVLMPVVFTSTLNQGRQAAPDGQEGSAAGEAVFSITQTPQVWLDHQVFETGGELVYNWDAVEELFPAGLLDDLFAAYQGLLGRLADGETAWRTPQILLPESQLRLIEEANATAAPVLEGLLHGPFLEQARRRSDSPAVITSRRTLTYGEIDRASLDLAHRLRRLGARPNHLIAVVMDKGWEQVVAVLAVLRSGAAYLPVDARLPAERIRHLLERGEASIAITQPDHDGLNLPAGVERVVLDEAVLSTPALEPLPALQTPEDLAYVIFTSGSTGQPKGVMIDHRGSLNTIMDVNRRFGVGVGDRILALSSLSFDLSVYDVFGLLAAGGAVVVPDAGTTRDPSHWAELAARAGVTVWNSVPALMEMLVEYRSGVANAPAMPLRLALLSGDWIPVRLPERIRSQFPGSQVISLGGATEASIWSILYPIDEVEPSWTSIPYGRAMASQTVRVLGEDLEPRPVWVPGDLYIGGTGLALGYWGDEEKTSASFLVHPRTGERLYRTGDLGRLLPDGNIEFLGRDDTQVKVQGHRIELGEIEAVLADHTAVSAAVVSVVGEREGPQQLVAYVRLHRGKVVASSAAPALPATVPTVVTDPIERLRFKLRHHGLRRDMELPVLPLAPPELPPEEVEKLYLRRRSYRKYLAEPLPLTDLSGFLSCLRQIEVEGSPLPKLRYGSAGNLYPVQAYLYVKHGRIEGLEGGTYYYNPKDHALFRLAASDGVSASLYDSVNHELFERASFGIFLIARLAAIAPLYGESSLRFATLEAGLMTQLLEESAPEHRIGLSQVGGVRFQSIRGLFALDETHELVHALLGGRIAVEQTGFAGFREEAGEYHALVRELGLEEECDQPLAPAIVILPPTRPEAEVFAELREHLRGRLPDYMVPAHFVHIDEIPLSANGKVDRKALPQPQALLTEPPAAGPVFVEPEGELERQIAAIVSEILGVDHVGARDNFFELGGNSVAAIRVISRISRLLGEAPPVRLLFERPRVRDLAEWVATSRGEAKSEAPPVVRVPRAPGVVLPLSFSQQRLWFLNRLEPDNSSYNAPAVLRLHGRLDLPALGSSLSEILRRHESLRTTFPEVDGQPRQEIASASPSLPLPVVDLAALPANLREAENARQVAAETARLFDLQKGPLMRAVLLRLDERDHVLAITAHHIVCDFWSSGIFVRELSTLYGAAVRGERSPLPELPVQYADFAAWQRSWLTGAVVERLVEAWRSQLAGVPAAIDLPTDRPYPPVQTFRGGSMGFHLFGEAASGIQALAGAAEVTPFMTLLAGWQTLLHRYSGQDDIVVGSPIHGRTRPEFEELIGLFINTLPLRGDLAGDPGFRELLERVRERALDAFALQDLPFEKLVEELQPPRDLARPPLFQVMLILQNTPAETLDLPGLTLSHAPVESGTARLELLLTLTETAEGLTGFLEYNADLFDRSTAERLLRHFETLLTGAAADPARRLSELPLLSSTEEDEILRVWNDTGEEIPASPVHRLFERQAALSPEAPALVASDEQLTYAELSLRANRLAHHLRRMGVGPEVLVGVSLERSAELVVTLLGILKAGGAYLPLDPTYPRERLRMVLEDAGASVLLTSRELAGSLFAGVPGETQVVCLDAEEALAFESGADLEGGAAADNLAYVLFTSGSTGRPKGVAVPHRALVNFLASMGQAPGIEAGERLLAVTSLSFDIAALEIFLPLLAGGCVELATREQAGDGAWLASRLETEPKIRVLQATPSTWRMLLDAGWQGDPALKALCGGEALPRDLASALRERAGELWNLYGPTETTVWSAAASLARDEAGPVPIGRPIANTRIYLLDRNLQPAPPSAAGRLHIGGAGVARGYLGRPDLTAERFVPDPIPLLRGGEAGARLYDTGDLARLRPDGTLEFLGRVDHQVKVRGFRIELGEIEAALARHPAVAQTVVLARTDRGSDPRLVAYLAATVPGEAPKPEELRTFLREGLPEYMLPAAFVALDAFPLTPNGKVDRKALPAPEITSPAREYVAPGSPVEEAMAALWAEVLGLERVGANDNFFELGGHSILATRLMFRVRETFGVELPLRILFSAPTLAGLSAAVSQEEPGTIAAAEALPRIRPDEAARALPFPLTDVQEAYWVGRSGAVQLGSVSTHVYFELDFPQIDLGRLELALRRLIDRHGMLRGIVLADGTQRILPEVPPYRIGVVDLRGAADPEPGLQAVRDRMSHQVLPSDRWPLFEIAATPFGRRTRVHVSLDLLIGDAWSFRILARDLSLFYADPGAELPPLELSFRDYVLAETALRGTSAYERALAYWRERAATLPPTPALPLAKSPGEIEKPRFVRRQGRLDSQAWGRLKERAARSAVTPSGVLLAAFAEALAAWCRSPRLTINLTLFNRLPLHPQVDDIVGDFTSLTLLAVEGLPGEPFEERARKVQGRLWDDLEHRLVSGVRVLRELARVQGGAVLMPVVFTSTLNQGQQAAAREQGDAAGEAVFSITQTPQVWLDHQVFESGGDLVYNWDAVEELFPAGLLDDLFAAYQGLLGRLADGETAWRTPQILLPESQLRLIEEANATAAPVPEGLLHEPLLEQARRRPDSPAVITSRRTLTYGEIDRASLDLAHRLRRLGARPNHLIAVVMDKGWEQVVAVLAVLRSGAAYLPVDARLPAERIRHLLERGEASIAITQPDPGLDLPAGVERVVLDETAFSTPALEPLPALQTPEDLAYVIFTSGSTGQPKGVMIDHRGALNTIMDVNRRFGVGASDRILALSSLSFDLSVYDVFGLLAAGGAVVVPDAGTTRDPSHWAELAARAGVTVWNSVPALMEMLVEYRSGIANAPVMPLRLALLSGDWIPVRLPERIRSQFPGSRVISLGGATEASIWSILYPIEDAPPSWTSIPYGRAMTSQTVRVLGEDLEPRPVWVPGDLYIGGIGLALGYWRDEEKTSAAFLIHPRTGERFYRTGDLGRLLPDGNIEFLGREDTQVKVQGHRIELGEIEVALTGHPTVSAAVVATVGERDAKQLAAYVVLRDGSPEAASIPSAANTAPVVDPIERLRFKLRHYGLRRDTELPRVPLAPPELSPEEVEKRYLRRRSYRKYLAEPLPLTDLSGFLSCLRQIKVAGSPLPKLRYGSAGNLYPVQAYLYVKPGRIEGIEGGAYYYNPKDHALLRLAASDGVNASLYDSVNHMLFERASFGIFLVARMAAIAPLYGESSLRFATLEAGLMTQLLEESAPEHRIGLSQVGGVRFQPIRGLFALDETHELVHALLGGRIAVEQTGLAGFREEAGEYHALVRELGLEEERDLLPAPAIVILPPPARPDGEIFTQLREHLRGKLPEYMVPAHFVRLAALPLSANGKVDRKALPRPEALSSAQKPDRPAFVAPESEIEQLLAGIVCEVLGVSQVGIHDNFFDLGANSVHMVRVYNALRQATGREMSMVDVFNHPSISLLARHLAEDMAERKTAHSIPDSVHRTERLREGKDWRKQRLQKRQAARS